jgi:hypothetical protein
VFISVNLELSFATGLRSRQKGPPGRT